MSGQQRDKTFSNSEWKKEMKRKRTKNLTAAVVDSSHQNDAFLCIGFIISFGLIRRFGVAIYFVLVLSMFMMIILMLYVIFFLSFFYGCERCERGSSRNNNKNNKYDNTTFQLWSCVLMFTLSLSCTRRVFSRRSYVLLLGTCSTAHFYLWHRCLEATRTNELFFFLLFSVCHCFLLLASTFVSARNMLSFALKWIHKNYRKLRLFVIKSCEAAFERCNSNFPLWFTFCVGVSYRLDGNPFSVHAKCNVQHFMRDYARGLFHL